MNFSPTKLGATVNHVSESKSCSFCKLLLGSEAVHCFSCFSIGPKHCFSECLGSSHYFCTASQCFKMLTQSRITSVARRGQKRQAEKMLSDTAKYLPITSIGDNASVSIPKVDRGKLGEKRVLGVIIEKSGIYFTIGAKGGILNSKCTRGEFNFGMDLASFNNRISQRMNAQCIPFLDH